MAKITKTRAYGIGMLSEETGVNIETIRYYERIGIMPEPGRTAGGNRSFDDNHLKRLSFIKRSRELGFSIEEIRTLLEMVDRDDICCGDVHDLAVAHINMIKKKISDLKRLEKVLKIMASECSKGNTPECPIIGTLFSAD